VLLTFPLTIPANTQASAPHEEEIALTHGVVTHVEVEFHPGCNGLVSAYVRDGLHQVWPTTADSKFHTDGATISWNEYHEMFKPPFKLVIGGYSPGTTYDHEIIFRFEITPREVAERGKVQGRIVSSIARAIGLMR
jgi:hypothetical protein